ncbi:MFS transporter [Convivina intestini]|uniref:MFS transporter n=1 Tax=Convivina intestini TaxID=1505726 RepID=A0A2U1DFB1_9LACO|nr:MFS transporter [Convivina intestini]PVY86376.1 MFS transporter [Convivina intestini]CAH1850593.1 Enterobactin exporter EntS [Convivina intestini]SDB83063.1 Major Facilitator Superfamily protein [Leuconostocaceae bacterium R-53105]
MKQLLFNLYPTPAKNFSFYSLWLSFLVSNLGDWMYRLALPIIILEKTGSAYHAATAFGISFIPWVLFSLIGGVLADNYSKRKILIVGNILAAIFSYFLLFTLNVVNINFTFLYLAIFLLASVDPLVHPSFQSIIPEIINRDDYVKANAVIQTIDNTLTIMGPLVGGSIVMLLGGLNALWFEIGSFIVSACILYGLPKIKESHKKQITLANIKNDILAGAKYSFHQKVIFSGSLMFFVTNFALNMFEANYIFYMTKDLGYPLVDATIALSLGGVGALLAGPVSTLIVERYHAGLLLSISTTLAGLSTLLLLVNTNYIYIGIVLGFISFFGTINVITYFTLRQRTVPREQLGRVVAITRMISYASIPIGSWFGGLLLNQGVSMIWIILIAGLLRTGAGLGAGISPLGHEK